MWSTPRMGRGGSWASASVDHCRPPKVPVPSSWSCSCLPRLCGLSISLASRTLFSLLTTRAGPWYARDPEPFLSLQGPPGAVGEPGIPGEAGMKVRRDERRESDLLKISSRLAAVFSSQRGTDLSCAWDNGFSVLLAEGWGHNGGLPCPERPPQLLPSSVFCGAYLPPCLGGCTCWPV